MIYAINHYAYASQLTLSQAANFFHQFVVTLSQDEATTKLGIPAANFTTLQGLDQRLTDYVSRSRKSNYTSIMQERDALRKAMFDAIFSLLYALKSADTDAKKASWVKVADLLTTYPIALKSLDYQSVTARIRGFLMDLRKVDGEELATNAFVTEQMLQCLESANEAFDTAYLARNSERQTLKQTDVQTLLSNLTSLMKLICAMIEVKANTAITTDPDNSGDVAAAQKAVGDINENINYYYTHFMKKGASSRDTDGDNTPDDIDPDGGTGTTNSGTGSNDSGSGADGGDHSGSDSGNNGGGSNSEAVI